MTATNPEAAEAAAAPSLGRLLAALPALPAPGIPPMPAHPGSLEDGSFVRRTAGWDSATRRGVFVHGMGGNSGNWTDLMYLLAPTMSGAALDLPGYGFSEPTSDNVYSIERNAQAVIDLIERDGSAQVDLFGNSLGGITSVAVAARRPDLVRTLTLVSPALMTRTTLARQHIPQLFDVVTGLRAEKKIGRRKMAERLTSRALQMCYADASRVSPERFAAMVDEVERRLGLEHSHSLAMASVRAVFASAARKGPESIWLKANRVTAPTLAIYGTADRLVPPRVAPRVAASFRRGRIVIFPDCGHVAQMEHPELTAQTVLQWIAQVEPEVPQD